jgi:hypothetical protein
VDIAQGLHLMYQYYLGS